MEVTFSPQEYIKFLGEELVHEFAKSGLTTHTHAVGGGRENSARTKLKLILPAGVGVGSGFIIDSFGNTSSQCDIILYEENFVMKFIVNDDIANTYYNCESVIAVGEVKSDATIIDIKDSIKKLKKVKKLKRYNDNGYTSRGYFSSLSITDDISGSKIPYNSDNNCLSQIYTFILCKSLKTPIDSIVKCLTEMCEEPHTFVNRIVTTDGCYISYLSRSEQQYNINPSRINSDAVFALRDNNYSFNHFISDLVNFIIKADTVPLDYSKYLSMPLQISDLKEIIEL